MPKATLGLLFMLMICLGQLVAAAPTLPARMPTHFDSAGLANGFSTANSFVITMGLTETGLAILFLLIAAFLPAIPNSLINMPHKDYWLAPGQRKESLRYLGNWLAWMGTGTLALFACMTWLTVGAATSPTPRIDPSLLWLTLGTFLALTLGMTIHLYLRFRIPVTPKVTGTSLSPRSES